MIASDYDYVIVGAGTAGCLLANRLSADPAVQVLVLEAGGQDRYPWIHVPAGYLYCIGNPRTDWCYSTEPEPALGGRRLAYARGRTLGGSSSINAMIYMRGHAHNYDHWASLGLGGWGWKDVLPHFLAHEDHHDPRGEHRAGGEWRVERQRLSWPILDALVEACAQTGIARTADFNSGDNVGASHFEVTQRRGFRLNTAKAFLHPVRGRKNLTLVTHAQAMRIGLEGRRATSVDFMARGEARTVRARREVILASGAVNTPQLLELSGIGNPQVLQSAGIEVSHELPQVGENLIDHLQLRMIYRIEGAATLNTRASSLLGRMGIGLEYLLYRRGPLTMAPSQAGAFVRSDHAGAAPDIHINFQPLSLDHFGAPLHDFPAVTVSLSNVQPTSRGTIHITGPEWSKAPSIAPNYLSSETDRQVAVASVRLARQLMQASSIARYRPQEFRPGTEIETDETIMTAAGTIASTIFHPCGTAAMGQVVDERLRVLGIDGLRIADASVIPAPISGGLAAPTLMIAEKAASMIREDAKQTAR